MGKNLLIDTEIARRSLSSIAIMLMPLMLLLIDPLLLLPLSIRGEIARQTTRSVRAENARRRHRSCC